VTAFAVALHPDRRAVGTGIGSAAPTPRRARESGWDRSSFDTVRTHSGQSAFTTLP